VKALISWWDLSNSEQTIDTMRAYLHDEGVGPWAAVPELVIKFWLSDAKNNRWGAVQVWEHDGPTANVPPNRAADLIGYPPTEKFLFDVEASIEGVHSLGALSGHGLALESATA